MNQTFQKPAVKLSVLCAACVLLSVGDVNFGLRFFC